MLGGPMREVRKYSALYHLKQWRKTQKKTFPSTCVNAPTLQETGLLPNDLEARTERPRLEVKEGQEDAMTLVGLDEAGNTLLIKVGLKAGRKANVWFQWKVKRQSTFIHFMLIDL